MADEFVIRFPANETTIVNQEGNEMTTPSVDATSANEIRSSSLQAHAHAMSELQMNQNFYGSVLRATVVKKFDEREAAEGETIRKILATGQGGA